MNRYLAVMVGGAFGSAVRYGIGVAIASRYPGRFPLATFLINVTGSFLIGLAFTTLPRSAPAILRPLIITGLLGGYTTFSSFEWETLSSTRQIAWLYVVSSVGLGLAACWLGASLGRWYAR